MRKEDDRPITEADHPRSLLALLATLEPIDDDFGAIDDLPAEPVAMTIKRRSPGRDDKGPERSR